MQQVDLENDAASGRHPNGHSSLDAQVAVLEREDLIAGGRVYWIHRGGAESARAEKNFGPGANANLHRAAPRRRTVTYHLGGARRRRRGPACQRSFRTVLR